MNVKTGRATSAPNHTYLLAVGEKLVPSAPVCAVRRTDRTPSAATTRSQPPNGASGSASDTSVSKARSASSAAARSVSSRSSVVRAMAAKPWPVERMSSPA